MRFDPEVFRKAEKIVGTKTSMSCWGLAFALDPKCDQLTRNLMKNNEYWLWNKMHKEDEASWFPLEKISIDDNYAKGLCDCPSEVSIRFRKHLLLEAALNIEVQGYARRSVRRSRKGAKSNGRRKASR